MNEILKDPKPMTVHCADGSSYEYTPKTELGLAWAELQNRLAAKGAKPHTDDEILKAMELERAGYDGLGMLWRNEDITSIQI
jgi:hypothetical protein